MHEVFFTKFAEQQRICGVRVIVKMESVKLLLIEKYCPLLFLVLLMRVIVQLFHFIE